MVTEEFESFREIFGAPPFIEPWIHFFVSPREMRLVTAIGRASVSVARAASILSESPSDTVALLEDAYRRSVLDREESDAGVRYRAGTFAGRLKSFCLFGNYHVMPREVRARLDEWDFEDYLERNGHFRAVLSADPDYDDCHNEWVLLLPEVEQMLDAATAIRLLPCDCKMLADRCGHSREICLILDARLLTDRTGGRDLGREEAKKLVRDLDAEGLVHTGGPPRWRESGPSVVCNCCACCCYPFRAARRLGTKGRWPRSRYLARFDRGPCRSCGRCASRCPFGAFSFAPQQRVVSFDPALCWGCGLCAGTCPTGAISMDPVTAG